MFVSMGNIAEVYVETAPLDNCDGHWAKVTPDWEPKSHRAILPMVFVGKQSF